VTAALRVVLDTRVVLSALVFPRGRLAPMRQAWQQKRCRPLASAETLDELMRALAYPKFELASDEQQELLAEYLAYCVAVRMPAKPPRTPAHHSLLDLPFLQLAVAGKADYLVTRDRALPALTGRLACPIVTAEQFLNERVKT
jgi:putative PIN family toxin of toxin-antitoxin system